MRGQDRSGIFRSAAPTWTRHGQRADLAITAATLAPSDLGAWSSVAFCAGGPTQQRPRTWHQPNRKVGDIFAAVAGEDDPKDSLWPGSAHRTELLSRCVPEMISFVACAMIRRFDSVISLASPSSRRVPCSRWRGDVGGKGFPIRPQCPGTWMLPGVACVISLSGAFRHFRLVPVTVLVCEKQSR